MGWIREGSLKTGKEIANTDIQGIDELPGKSQPLGTTTTVTQTLTCTFFTSGEEKGETNTSAGQEPGVSVVICTGNRCSCCRVRGIEQTPRTHCDVRMMESHHHGQPKV